MSVPLGREADHDPLDISRQLILAAAEKAARYASMVAELIEMRDDDLAEPMRRALVTQVKAMNTAFSSLAAGHDRQPARDAAATFFRMPENAQP